MDEEEAEEITGESVADFSVADLSLVRDVEGDVCSLVIFEEAVESFSI